MKKIFIIIFILSPLFWWTMVYSFPKLISELSKIGQYTSNQKASLFSESNLKKVDDLRWNDQINHLNPYPKVFFNKATVILNQIFESLGNLGPRTFFVNGDSFAGNPKNVEPIPLILLPISIMGIIRLFKKGSKKLLLLPSVGVIPLLTGQPTLFYIFPAGLFYIYAASYEIYSWKKSNRTKFLVIFIIYSLFIFRRSLL